MPLRFTLAALLSTFALGSIAVAAESLNWPLRALPNALSPTRLAELEPIFRQDVAIAAELTAAAQGPNAGEAIAKVLAQHREILTTPYPDELRLALESRARFAWTLFTPGADDMPEDLAVIDHVARATARHPMVYLARATARAYTGDLPGAQQDAFIAWKLNDAVSNKVLIDDLRRLDALLRLPADVRDTIPHPLSRYNRQAASAQIPVGLKKAEDFAEVLRDAFANAGAQLATARRIPDLTTRLKVMREVLNVNNDVIGRLKLAPDDEKTWLAIIGEGEALLRTDPAAAETLFLQAEALAPHKVIFFALGEVDARLGRLREALIGYDLAAWLDGEWKEPKAAYEKVRDQLRDQARNAGIEARAAYARGDADAARSILATARENHPTNTELLVLCSDLANVMQAPAEAKQYLEQAVAIDSYNADALARLAFFEFAQRKFDEAHEILLQRDFTHGSADYLAMFRANSRFRDLAQNGGGPEALAILRRTLDDPKLHPDIRTSTVALSLQVQIANMIGDREGTVLALSRLANALPFTPAALHQQAAQMLRTLTPGSGTKTSAAKLLELAAQHDAAAAKM